MNTISRRIRRLERGSRPTFEEEKARRSVELLLARQRRLAEECGEPFEDRPRDDLTGLTVVEILRRRQRNAEWTRAERG